MLLDISNSLSETKTFNFSFTLVSLLTTIVPVVIITVIIITMIKHRKNALLKHHGTSIDETKNEKEDVKKSQNMCEYCGSALLSETQNECPACGAKKLKK